ncbi:MAG TPA: hypothetical protein PLI54_02220 [Methanoculleus sp.]|nr:hypothetical protein [Methanoculleus sp.]MBP7144350.1 hypothetical protein [Methanoculleus sp.]HNT08682.1 hypothetical protein [Methanoculleus sp.]HNV38143.1 hypothetical protein [Methanoculleus sp.]HOC83223.1 hypothetical protein [Methanoculleus sp.]HOF97216.1 hypothetical protein [Methanoculleus sp.]
MDDTAPRLGIPPIVYQDAINNHFDLLFLMLPDSHHSKISRCTPGAHIR